jgi:hypothetical protein
VKTSNKIFAVLGRAFVAIVLAVFIEGRLENRYLWSQRAASTAMAAGEALSEETLNRLQWTTFVHRYSNFLVTLPLVLGAIVWGVVSVRRDRS